jgi:hypothetical protein
MAVRSRRRRCFSAAVSGPAKIRSDDAKHGLSLVHYLRTIGYNAWIEDTNGNEIEETLLKKGGPVGNVPGRDTSQ